MAKRRKYPAELKAKVALEALRGEQTLAQLSARYNVHPNLIATWKRQAKGSLVDVFNGGGQKRDAQHEAEIKEYGGGIERAKCPRMAVQGHEHTGSSWVTV